MGMRIYLDAARSRRIFPEAAEEVKRHIVTCGVPSGLYREAMETNALLEACAQKVSEVLGCDADDVVFTSGGTEANNMAILGYAQANADVGKHLVVSRIEHPSVLAPVKMLIRSGFEVDFVDCNRHGIVSLDHLSDLVRRDTVLVSIQLVNHEIGTIQPLKEIAELVKDRSPASVHTDASLAIGRLPVRIHDLGVDIISGSGHHFSGPYGTGFLAVREGVKLEPIMGGETSFHRLRPGVENIPGIAGLVKALEIADARKEAFWTHARSLRFKLLQGIRSIEHVRINSPEVVPDVLWNPAEPMPGFNTPGVPDILNVTFKYMEGEAMTLLLDMEGISVSTGSACASWNLQANYVLVAMGLSYDEAHGSIRFSFDDRTSLEEIDRVLDVLPGVVSKLRKISAFKPEEIQ